MFEAELESSWGLFGSFTPDQAFDLAFGDDPSILKMAAQDADFEAQEDARFARNRDLLEVADSNFNGDNLELDIAGAEIVRRLQEGIEGKEVGKAYGEARTAKQLKRLATEARDFADKAAQAGYTDKQVGFLTNLAEQLDEMAAKGAGVTYVFDFALPHETHHKLVLNFLNGKKIKEGWLDKLEKHGIKDTGLVKSVTGQGELPYTVLYPNNTREADAFEIAAMLETGEMSHPNKDAFLRDFADGILDATNGEINNDPRTYERILKYRSDNKAADGRGRTDTETSRSSDESSGTQSKGKRDGDKATGEFAGTDESDGGFTDGTDRTGESDTFEPGGDVKLSQTPETMRTAGIQSSIIPIDWARESSQISRPAATPSRHICRSARL